MINHNPSPEEVIRNIDWQLLREQKGWLSRMIMNAHDEKEVAKAEGLLYLLDTLQDCAADYLGLENEKVFGFKLKL